MSLLGAIRNSYKVNRAFAIVNRAVFDPVRAAYRRAMLGNKLRRTKSPKIHFGCGEVADPRFINVDARAFPHVDYVTWSPLMPALPAGHAEMLYACHVLEHISWQQQLNVLRRWRELLKPGGELLLSVPSFDKITALYTNKSKDFEWMQAVLMGGQDYSGNFHYSLFTKDRLRELLDKSGFENIRERRSADQIDWPRDWSWDETLSLNLRADNPSYR